VEATSAWATANGGIDLTLHPTANIGDTWSGTAFIKPAKDLNTVKTERIDLMNTTYETLEHAPISYMATTFQADDASVKLMSYVLAAQGGTAPTGFAWYDSANAAITMTNAQFQGLASAIYLRNRPLYINKQTKKAAIRAALTVAAVEAIVW